MTSSPLATVRIEVELEDGSVFEMDEPDGIEPDDLDTLHLVVDALPDEEGRPLEYRPAESPPRPPSGRAGRPFQDFID